MANRPTTYTNWTDGNSSKVIEPPSSYKLQGFTQSERPNFEHMNWILYNQDQWIQFLDNEVSQNAFILNLNQNLRLLTQATFHFNQTSGVLSFDQPLYFSIPSISDSYNQIAEGQVTLKDGEVAYFESNLPFNAKADLAQGSQFLYNLSSTIGIQTGDLVLNSNLPSGTTVTSVSGNTIGISQASTGAITQGNFTFISNSSLSVQVSLNSSLNPQSNSVIFARRFGNEVYLGINSNVMLLRHLESKKYLDSGFVMTYQAQAGASVSSGQALYMNSNQVFPLDASNSSKSQFMGFALNDASQNEWVSVLTDGFLNGSYDPGSLYYADANTPGEITTSKPVLNGQQTVVVGVAVSSTQLITSSALLAINGAVGSGGPEPTFKQEVPQGIIDGTNLTFTLSLTPKDQGSLLLLMDSLPADTSKWDLSGSTITFNQGEQPTAGQSLSCFYIAEGQSNLGMKQEVPQGLIDGTNSIFTLSSAPFSQASMLVYLDDLKLNLDQFSLNQSSTSSQIVFLEDSIPQPGQNVYVAYFQNVAVGSVPSSGGGASSYQTYTEYPVLNASNLTTHSVTLSQTPLYPSSVLLDIIGGDAQVYGVDYIVSGNLLSWNGLGLNSTLIAGDQLRVRYEA